MSIDTDRLRKAFTVLAEPLPGLSPAEWADMKRLCNAAIDAADEIDRLRALLTDVKQFVWLEPAASPRLSGELALLCRIDAAIDGGVCATCNGTGQVERDSAYGTVIEARCPDCGESGL